VSTTRTARSYRAPVESGAAVEKVASNSPQVYEIVFSAATAAQVQQYQRDAQALVDNLAKNAPAGTEAVVAAWKSAISTASATYETAKKATKQVAQVEAAAKSSGRAQSLKLF
jgi:hypothetical protein